ncbi:xylulose kinase-like [Watersipora subatra]|uniref:xylulose kinase-like n=1 Tax=Watersipora subatra TaxID=2589382 RepID=UPI00355BD3A1
MDNEQFYLGFDFSTQSLKVVAVNDHFDVIIEESIKFDDIGKYKTSDGCHINPDGLTVTSPTIMWVDALDIVLGRLLQKGFNFQAVKAISGAGQQHGSVYWKKGAEKVLASLNPSSTLETQLKHCFTLEESPIWMDSSTKKQCKYLEAAVGGSQAMTDLTGSRAYERFTGNQILKVIQNYPEIYQQTERISLVSSFAASLLRGAYCQIDESDGSGMNLMNIKLRDWDETLAKACSPDLQDKLGIPVPTVTVQGSISKYFVERYSFSDTCQIVSFTGDNPSSLAGMKLAKGEVAVSLGSSDVLFLWLENPLAKTEGHIFVNPVDTKAYMALLCFKNGSLTRAAIRDKYAHSDWSHFETLLLNQPRGNNGKIGFYYTIAEIIPDGVEGCYYFDETDQQVEDFADAEHIRAVIESQFLSRRVHAEDMGFELGKDCRVLATGGASNNHAILQVMSDIFNAPVYTQSVANSAALGAAMLAMHAVNVTTDNLSYKERVHDTRNFELVAQPQPDSKQVYDVMAARYRKLEKQAIELHRKQSGQ